MLYLLLLLSYQLNSNEIPKIIDEQNSQSMKDNTENSIENENENENKRDGEDLKLLHFLIESVANDHRGLVFLVSTKNHTIFCMRVQRYSLVSYPYSTL